MNKKEKIEQAINVTLQQFDQPEQLASNPYFYSRVQARIKERQQQHGRIAVILRPAIIIVLFAVNISTAIWYLGDNTQTNATDTRRELIEILAGDLNLNKQTNNSFILE